MNTKTKDELQTDKNGNGDDNGNGNGDDETKVDDEVSTDIGESNDRQEYVDNLSAEEKAEVQKDIDAMQTALSSSGKHDKHAPKKEGKAHDKHAPKLPVEEQEEQETED